MKKQLLSMLCAVFILAGVNAQSGISFSGKPGTCQANSATLSASLIGGSINTTYAWSNGATGSALRNIGPGTYCVTATDVSQSVSACYTVTSATVSTAVTSIPNGNILLTGGNPNTLYLGYGPQSTTLSTTTTGSGNITYSWTPSTGLSCSNCAAPVFTPTAAGLYTYTVTATNGTCSATASITICVMDIRVPGTTNKVYVCHIPPGNHGNPQTISVSTNAVNAHVPLHGGDRLGSCSQQCGSGKDDEEVSELLPDMTESGFEVLLYPNPFTGRFHLNIQSNESSSYGVRLYSLTGQLMEEHDNLDPQQEVTLGEELSKGIYFARITQQNSTRSIRVTKTN